MKRPLPIKDEQPDGVLYKIVFKPKIFVLS